MEEDKNKNNVPKEKNPVALENFKGYTLEELQWQRAFVALQAELAKETLLAKKDALTSSLPIIGKKDGKYSLPANNGKTMQRIISSLSYLDYFRMASSVVRSGIKIYKFFRRK